ncbi:hypothetical protein GCM10020219_011070 [Nonomuraea dietziae]
MRGSCFWSILGGSAPEAAALGMERIERGVYRRWVPVAEVEICRSTPYRWHCEFAAF